MHKFWFFAVCVFFSMVTNGFAQSPTVTYEAIPWEPETPVTEHFESAIWGGGWDSGLSHGLFFGAQTNFPAFSFARMSLTLEGHDGQDETSSDTFSGMEAYLGPQFRFTHGAPWISSYTNFQIGVKENSFFWRDAGINKEKNLDFMLRGQGRFSHFQVETLFAYQPEIGYDVKYDTSNGQLRLALDYTSRIFPRFSGRAKDLAEARRRHTLKWGVYTAWEQNPGEYRSLEFLAGLEYDLRIFAGARNHMILFARAGTAKENLLYRGDFSPAWKPKIIWGLAITISSATANTTGDDRNFDRNDDPPWPKTPDDPVV